MVGTERKGRQRPGKNQRAGTGSGWDGWGLGVWREVDPGLESQSQVCPGVGDAIAGAVDANGVSEIGQGEGTGRDQRTSGGRPTVQG